MSESNSPYAAPVEPSPPKRRWLVGQLGNLLFLQTIAVVAVGCSGLYPVVLAAVAVATAVRASTYAEHGLGPQDAIRVGAMSVAFAAVPVALSATSAPAHMGSSLWLDLFTVVVWLGSWAAAVAIGTTYGWQNPRKAVAGASSSTPAPDLSLASENDPLVALLGGAPRLDTFEPPSYSEDELAESGKLVHYEPGD